MTDDLLADLERRTGQAASRHRGSMNKICRHCASRVIPCRCIAHGPPMWKHKATGYHRCGPDGTGKRCEP